MKLKVSLTTYLIFSLPKLFTCCDYDNFFLHMFNQSQDLSLTLTKVLLRGSWAQSPVSGFTILHFVSTLSTLLQKCSVSFTQTNVDSNPGSNYVCRHNRNMKTI